mmetsp:Transcript_96450/g.299921  ORF Transcript_96450/g.299921 Transcript_96450/m.299921 type:complete len:91 (-) Transcript_96450:359-631(-)
MLAKEHRWPAPLEGALVPDGPMLVLRSAEFDVSFAVLGARVCPVVPGVASASLMSSHGSVREHARHSCDPIAIPQISFLAASIDCEAPPL